MRVLRFSRDHSIAPKEQALYVLALESGLSLESYQVAAEDQRRASEIAREIKAMGGKMQPTDPPSKATKPSKKTVQLEAGSVDLGALPQIVDTYTGAAHSRSATAYRVFYLLENSARATIERVLTAKHGESDWWTKGVDPEIQKAATNRRKQDVQDPWHDPRGDHDIYYIDLHHYAAIITSASNWPLFKPIFGRKEFVTETFERINVSRRVVAHMNPLSKDDYDHLRSQAKAWFKALNAAEAAGHAP